MRVSRQLSEEQDGSGSISGSASLRPSTVVLRGPRPRGDRRGQRVRGDRRRGGGDGAGENGEGNGEIGSLGFRRDAGSSIFRLDGEACAPEGLISN